METFISSMVFQLIPGTMLDNPYVWLGLAIVVSVLSEVMPFLPTKSNGIAQFVLNILKALLGRKPAQAVAQAAVDTAQADSGEGVTPDPLNADK